MNLKMRVKDLFYKTQYVESPVMSTYRYQLRPWAADLLDVVICAVFAGAVVYLIIQVDKFFVIGR